METMVLSLLTCRSVFI